MSDNPGLIAIVDGLATMRNVLESLERGEDHPLPPEFEFAPDDAFLGCLANLRPLAATIARELGDRDAITLVCPSDSGQMCTADGWLAGMVIRTLFEELDSPTELTDAAGLAITTAMSYADPMSALQGSRRGRTMSPEALHRACQTNIIGLVPTRNGLVAQP